jgi:hypothetical protein
MFFTVPEVARASESLTFKRTTNYSITAGDSVRWKLSFSGNSREYISSIIMFFEDSKRSRFESVWDFQDGMGSGKPNAKLDNLELTLSTHRGVANGDIKVAGVVINLGIVDGGNTPKFVIFGNAVEVRNAWSGGVTQWKYLNMPELSAEGFNVRGGIEGSDISPKVKSLKVSPSAASAGNNLLVSAEIETSSFIWKFMIKVTTPTGGQLTWLGFNTDRKGWTSPGETPMKFTRLGNKWEIQFNVTLPRDTPPGEYKISTIYSEWNLDNVEIMNTRDSTKQWGGILHQWMDSTQRWTIDGWWISPVDIFPAEKVSFAVQDSGQKYSDEPKWTRIEWTKSKINAGEYAILEIDIDAFDRYISNVVVGNFYPQNGGNMINNYVYETEMKLINSNQLYGSKNSSWVRKGTFVIPIYFDRGTTPGRYNVSNIQIETNRCPKAIPTLTSSEYKECDASNLNGISSRLIFNNGLVSGKSWEGFINPLGKYVEILPKTNLLAPEIEFIEKTPTSISFSWDERTDVECNFSSNPGSIYKTQTKGVKTIHKIMELKSEQEVTIRYDCQSQDGARVSGTLTTKSLKSIQKEQSKPTTPTFSGVNFVGNNININVNIGSSSSSRPDKVYLVAPKLGINSSTPVEGKISGSTASWSLPLGNILSGVAIPLEIVGEKNGVKSEPLTGSYIKPATSVTAVPPAPTNYTSRIVGSSAIITIQVSAKESSRASTAHLYSSALGIKKNAGLQGDVVGTKALIEVPIKASMAGKKYPITIYLKNSKGESTPLNATLSIPKAPKAPTLPTALPKPVVPKAVICSFGTQTRTFEDECPPGWEKR